MSKFRFLALFVVFALVMGACSEATSPTPEPTPVPTMAVPTVVPTAQPTVVPTPELSKSPCDLVMTTDQFMVSYLGQEAVFAGVYHSAYTFYVGGKLVCATLIGSHDTRFGELTIFQDTVSADGEKRSEMNPVFDENFNGLIGFSGVVTNDQVYPDLMGDMILYNANAIVLNQKPGDCQALTDETVKQFSGKAVTIIYSRGVGVSADTNNQWMEIAFTYDGQPYCYDSAWFELRKTVTDITGREVASEDFGWGGNTWFMQGLTGVVSFYIGQFSHGGGDVGFEKDIMTISVGNPTDQAEYGDPMVFEILSRSASYSEVFFWTPENGSRYFLINSVLPDKVNPGYLISPKEYVNGGELTEGTVLGVINGNPLVVTAMECAFSGFSMQPIQAVNYAWMDNTGDFDQLSSGSESAYPDYYLYLMEGTGEGQTITYFHVPGGCPEWNQ